MKINTLFTGAALLLSSCLVSAHAEEGDYKFAGKETVVCVKNASDSELIIVVGEQFVMDKRLRSRTIQSMPGRTACMRYDDIQYAWVEFTTAEKVENGDQITASDLRNPTCRRIRGGRAKYLLLDIKDNGKQTCIADDRADADIRALVANARPLTD